MPFTKVDKIKAINFLVGNNIFYDDVYARKGVWIDYDGKDDLVKRDILWPDEDYIIKYIDSNTHIKYVNRIIKHNLINMDDMEHYYRRQAQRTLERRENREMLYDQKYKEWACPIIKLHEKYWEHNGNTVENEDILVIQDCIKCIDKEMWENIGNYTPLQEQVYALLYTNKLFSPEEPTEVVLAKRATLELENEKIRSTNLENRSEFMKMLKMNGKKR